MKPLKLFVPVLFLIVTFLYPLSAYAGTKVEKTSVKTISPVKQADDSKRCGRAPEAQVVNSSGLSIFKVRIGSVEFSKNLSRCFDGCSTGFKRVQAGSNSVSVQFTKSSPWVTLGSVKKFANCTYYSVNIIKKGTSVCAELSARSDTNLTYNSDRAKRKVSQTCRTVRKASVKSPLAASKKAPMGKKYYKPEPKIVSQQKKVILKFTTPVKRLVIRDNSGKQIQSFQKGDSFDITKSVKKSSGKNLRLTYFNSDRLPKNPTSPGNMVPFEGEIHFNLPVQASFRRIFDSLKDLDRNEPENNTINGAVNAISGTLSGEVGSGDPSDFFYIRTSPRGVGTYFKIERRGSNPVTLHLYDPRKGYLLSDNNSVWIAVAPNTTFYVQVEAMSDVTTPYELEVTYEPVLDAMEPNDTFGQAKSATAGGNRVLCNLFNASADYVGIKDYYKFTMTSEKLVEILVDNSGLGSSQTVALHLYDKYQDLHTSSTDGNTNRASIRYDLRGMYGTHPPFPAGDWFVLVTTHSETNARPYGTGSGSRNYTGGTSYSFDLTLTD